MNNSNNVGKMGTIPEIILAETIEEYLVAKKLFIEYADELGIDLGFQGFTTELETISEQYGPGCGGIYLLKDNGEVVGCIALRRLEENIGEIKRLYLREAFRSKGYGRILVERIISLAVEKGYTLLRLDTLDTMHSAIRLYKSFGFYEIEKYRVNPFSNARFFELKL